MTDTFGDPNPYLVQPGILIRTRVNLGQQDREIGFEASIDRDASQAEIDHLCDKMVAAGDRLRAKTLLPDYRRNRENVLYKHEGNRKRHAELVARLEESAKIREEHRVKITALKVEAVKRAEEEHYATGRRGNFKAGPAVTREQDAALEELRKGEEKERAEADMQFAQLATELEDGARAIEQWDVLIGEMEALLHNEG